MFKNPALLTLLFTGDSVMVAMEKLIFKVADPIQEFVLRRLCGELQEVNGKSPSSEHECSRRLALMCPCALFFLQLFDVERAEMYLTVLRQLVVMYRSTPQHRNKLQRNDIPKLVKYSLKVLQEPSQQV